MGDSASRRADQYRRRRRCVLKHAADSCHADAILVTAAADIRYLCGATEGGRLLLVSEQTAILYTSRMFQVQATEECPGITIRVPRGDLFRDMATTCADEGLKALGFQDTHMTVNRYNALERTLTDGQKLVYCGSLTDKTRTVKDKAEIEATRRAVEIAEAAFRDLMTRGADGFVGQTERQIAARLNRLMAAHGADRSAFDTIVAAGADSYHCHHVPGDRVIAEGDPVLVDWGAEVDGYRSDITRVLFPRQVPEALACLYEIVLRAHDAAVDAIRPRVHCHTVNAKARGLIAKAGYDKEFRHGLGHGIGLEVHEHPYLSAKPADGRRTPLRSGMIVTVEPGIYLRELGGIRIEDDILVTTQGHESLTRLPTALNDMILK